MAVQHLGSGAHIEHALTTLRIRSQHQGAICLINRVAMDVKTK
jgi:hypothetical protein